VTSVAHTGIFERTIHETVARVLLAIVWTCCVPTLVQGQEADRIVATEVDGTLLRVRLASGKELSGVDLVGATLSLALPGASARPLVRVVSITLDPNDPGREVHLYRMASVDPRTGHAEELCGEDAQGDRWAFPVQGQWDDEGNRLPGGGFTLVCSDGAVGKCVRFGYKPWKTHPDGTRLADYHQACVRLVRADYCGGRGTTRDGMLIDLYDRLGIQQPAPNPEDQGLRFEAAWSPAGAVCVAHTRVPENITLEQLATECPRLAGHLGAQACTSPEDGIYDGEALLYNLSR